MVLAIALNLLSSPGYAQKEGAQIPEALWSAMVTAAATHPSVNAARISARAAGVDVKDARWRRFPSVSVEGLLRAGRGDVVQPRIAVDQPLWSGGRITQTIRRASAREDVAIAGYDEAVQSISLDVVQAYYDVVRWRTQRNILLTGLSLHQDMTESMTRRVSQGVSPTSDLELARARTLQIRQQMVSARAQENAAFQRFGALIGQYDYSPSFVVDSADPCPRLDGEKALYNSLAYDPQLRRLRFQVTEANADAAIARAFTLPQVSTQYSYDEIFGNRIGLALRLQTDGGLSRFAAAEAAALRRQSSDLQVVAAERKLRDQVVADLEAYRSSCDRLVSGDAAVQSARNVRESYLRQFTSGRRSWLDVMNSVREAMAAEIDALEASVGRSASLSRIMLRTGGWQPGSKRLPS